MKHIYKFFKLLWFYVYVNNKLKQEAHNRYRVIEISKNKFELQCYQDVSITSDTGPDYKWTPLIVSPSNVSKDKYIKNCDKLRDGAYRNMIEKHLSKINKIIEPKYPIVIY